MNKKKIWVAIVGAGVVAALSAAVKFFPDAGIILAGISGLITAVMAYINGADNNE